MRLYILIFILLFSIVNPTKTSASNSNKGLFFCSFKTRKIRAALNLFDIKIKVNKKRINLNRVLMNKEKRNIPNRTEKN